MASLLSTAHNVISSCCGSGLEKVFGKGDGDAEDQNATPAAATTPAAAAPAKPAAPTKKFGFTHKQAKYSDIKFAKLPLSARKAAKAIGFEEETWDEPKWLEIDDKHWGDLTDEEKTACETLGWDEVSWDDKYEGQSWEDLPKHVKQAAEKLGWDQEKWDEDGHVESWEKSWEDFTEEEKRCLHVIGYYVHTWG